MILYKRNAQSKPIFWTIKDDGKQVIVQYGLVGTNGHTELLDKKLIKANEVESRIKAKRKEGYKELKELYDNAPENLNGVDLMSYLNTYLPKYNTTSEGFILPMRCKTLTDNKPFTKDNYFGQWKINGLRCIIGAIKISTDMFNPIRLTYTSREGISWSLPWMDEIILPSLSKQLIEMMVEEGVCLDGELYIPAYTINEINSFVKNPTLPQHKQLQFWCYDICIDNMTAIRRSILRKQNIKRHIYSFGNAQEHFNCKDQFVVLPDTKVSNYDDAIRVRDNFISLGFEGLVIRNYNAEYQYGKRNQAMMKFKKIHDGKFIIIDIVPEGVRTNLPKFILKNDINDEQFECTINTNHQEQEYILKNKDWYKGRLAFVEYRERSGIKQVPFHAKIIKLL